MLEEMIEKVKSFTEIDSSTKCWLFKGATTSKGYGLINFKGKTFKIHRISAAFYLNLNYADNNQHALHKLECKNKNCWNPDHLYIGNNFDNQRDSIESGTCWNPTAENNRNKTHCLNGHLLEGNNLYIAKDGRRRCIECRKQNTKKSYQRKQKLLQSIKENIKCHPS